MRTPASAVVLRLLGGGKVTIADLATATGYPRRAIEAAIEELRLGGTLIASDGEGVWLPQTVRDARPRVEALRRRAITQLVTYRAQRAALRALEAREAAPLVMPWAGR